MRLHIAATIAAVLITQPTHAANPQAMREAVDLASEVCGEIQREGSGSQYELSGAAEAKVKGFFKNFVDVGAGGNASTSGSKYDNVVRDELAAELKNARDCRKDMSKYFIDKLDLSSSSSGGAGQGVIQPASLTPDISGTWSYSGVCPYGISTVEVRGEFRMQRVGDSQYAGQAYSSLGLTGQFQSVVSGSNVRSDIRWSDASQAVANGQLSGDGRVMDITDTAGCRTRAFLLN